MSWIAAKNKSKEKLQLSERHLTELLTSQPGRAGGSDCLLYSDHLGSCTVISSHYEPACRGESVIANHSRASTHMAVGQHPVPLVNR